MDKKVGYDNFFTVVTNRTVPQHESFAIRAKMEELQFGTPFEQTMEQIHELTSSIYSNYLVIAYDGHKRVYIGPSQKKIEGADTAIGLKMMVLHLRKLDIRFQKD